MFKDEELNKAYEKTRELFENNLATMNAISEDILTLDKWLEKNLYITEPFKMLLTDSEELSWCPKLRRLIYESSEQAPVNARDCKFIFKKTIHRNLPKFLTLMALHLPKIQEAES